MSGQESWRLGPRLGAALLAAVCVSAAAACGGTPPGDAAPTRALAGSPETAPAAESAAAASGTTGSDTPGSLTPGSDTADPVATSRSTPAHAATPRPAATGPGGGPIDTALPSDPGTGNPRTAPPGNHDDGYAHNVSAGATCPRNGALGFTTDVRMVLCATTSSDPRLRWRIPEPGSS